MKKVKKEPWMEGLSNRVINVLMRGELFTKEAAIKAIQTGRLVALGYTPICRNYGKKAERELCQFLGIPVSGESICPCCGQPVKYKQTDNAPVA